MKCCNSKSHIIFLQNIEKRKSFDNFFDDFLELLIKKLKTYINLQIISYGVFFIVQ